MFKPCKRKFDITLPLFLALSSLTFLARAEPAEATYDAVKYCQSLGMVTGYSGYGKHNGAHWKHIAQRRALRQASKLGATHIVWKSLSPLGAFNGYVTGNAYKCQ
jgi:hypothetical protein